MLPWPIVVILFRPNTFQLNCLSFQPLDDGYSINVSCALNLISTVLFTITRSIPLLVNCQSPRVPSSQQSVFLSLGRYLRWWTISPRGYHPPCSQCFYHWAIPPLMGYQSPKVSPTLQSVFLSLGRYLRWWTICPRGYHPPCSQCFYHWVIPPLMDYQSPKVSPTVQSVFLSLGRYLRWWTISPRGQHPPVVSVSALTWLIIFVI